MLSMSSALCEIYFLTKATELSTAPQLTKNTTYPPWHFVDDLTSSAEYCQQFKASTLKFTENKWNLLYTDGSKTTCGVGFAVVTESGQPITNGTLPLLASVIIGCQKSLAVFLLNFQLFIKLVTIMRFKSNMRRFVR